MSSFVQMCSRCGKPILATNQSPVVAAPSLGAGYFHFRCAQVVWAERRQEAVDEEEDKAVKRRIRRRKKVWVIANGARKAAVAGKNE